MALLFGFPLRGFDWLSFLWSHGCAKSCDIAKASSILLRHQ